MLETSTAMYHYLVNKEMENCYCSIQMQHSISYLYIGEFDAPFMVESQQLHNMKSITQSTAAIFVADGFKLSSL